jgi:hypothetical protein
MSPHWQRTPLDLMDAILRIMEKRAPLVTPGNAPGNAVTEGNA